MNIIVSFTSGIIAAFTPCVIVLIPLVLYKFFKKEKKQIKEFILLVLGFLTSYILLSIIIASLFTSIIQNGIKLGFGLLFLTLGVLALMEKINPLNFSIIKNSFLLGSIFALLTSLSPCSLPYLGIIISLSNKTKIFISILFFGIGLLTPSILFAILGQKIINFASHSKKIFYIINRLMSIVLVGAGIYLMLSIKSIGPADVYASLVLLALVFFIIIKSFFIINNFTDLKKISNILLLVALVLIIITTVWQCNNTIKYNYTLKNNNNFFTDQVLQKSNIESTSIEHVCRMGSQHCQVCQKCIRIFSLSFILGIIGILLTAIEHRQKQK